MASRKTSLASQCFVILDDRSLLNATLDERVVSGVMNASILDASLAAYVTAFSEAVRIPEVVREPAIVSYIRAVTW